MGAGETGAGRAQQETAPEIRGAECKPGEHRCVALMLGFFALWEAGPSGTGSGALDDLTMAAVARCEAGQGMGLS